jgi:hypothetical protein
MRAERELTIIAQDPSVRAGPSGGDILTTKVTIPYEDLSAGPRGYRVHVVDYDASQRVFYEPAELGRDADDQFRNAPDQTLLTDPAFHAQNVYAIVMRVLCRFEFALGRRVAWSFRGHQINLVPHAFCDANACYSESDHSIFFGYVPTAHPDADHPIVFTCLSHDIVAHEATHALLDGLRDSYTLPSGPDQAGFHEAFADIVALLSVFGVEQIVGRLLAPNSAAADDQIGKERLEVEALKQSVLFGLAEEFGQEVSRFRRFLEVWLGRMKDLLSLPGDSVPLQRAVRDGVAAAQHLLTMVIRALDYCPVVDLHFSEFLTALLTADYELLPDDGRYKYRDALRKQFALWGIGPPYILGHEDAGRILEEGIWERPKDEEKLRYEGIHPESLRRDPDEVFRFLWENRKTLRVFEHAHTVILSVRPCLRIGPDGFFVRETVSEYLQILDLRADQLRELKINKPEEMPGDTPVRLYGGGVLIFDEFSRLKYHICSRVNNADAQGKRLAYLWRNGIRDSDGRYGRSDGSPPGQRFARMHLRRDGQLPKEEWDA